MIQSFLQSPHVYQQIQCLGHFEYQVMRFMVLFKSQAKAGIFVLAGNQSGWVQDKVPTTFLWVVVPLLILFSKPFAVPLGSYCPVADMGTGMSSRPSPHSLWNAVQDQMHRHAVQRRVQEFISNLMGFLSWATFSLQPPWYFPVPLAPPFWCSSQKLWLQLPCPNVHLL